MNWLTSDCIALEIQIDYRTGWMILERVTDGTTPLGCIAGQYVRAGR
ncbi:MAG: hypothetical protein J6M53_05930 [Bacteroidaceae bacterium]|nr:hypothetical protein [Bacteroidaceae bacterium]